MNAKPFPTSRLNENLGLVKFGYFGEHPDRAIPRKDWSNPESVETNTPNLSEKWTR
jgi:hypothetical protein